VYTRIIGGTRASAELKKALQEKTERTIEDAIKSSVLDPVVGEVYLDRKVSTLDALRTYVRPPLDGEEAPVVREAPVVPSAGRASRDAPRSTSAYGLIAGLGPELAAAGSAIGRAVGIWSAADPAVPVLWRPCADTQKIPSRVRT
jgi:hypothetical protein